MDASVEDRIGRKGGLSCQGTFRGRIFGAKPESAVDPTLHANPGAPMTGRRHAE